MGLSNYTMWMMICGFFIPPVEAVIQQSHFSNALRATLNFIMCCAVAVGITYWQAHIDFHNWLKSALVILVTAIATYHGMWKPTNIAPTVEKKSTMRVSFGIPTPPTP